MTAGCAPSPRPRLAPYLNPRQRGTRTAFRSVRSPPTVRECALPAHSPILVVSCCHLSRPVLSSRHGVPFCALPSTS